MRSIADKILINGWLECCRRAFGIGACQCAGSVRAGLLVSTRGCCSSLTEGVRFSGFVYSNERYKEQYKNCTNSTDSS